MDCQCILADLKYTSAPGQPLAKPDVGMSVKTYQITLPWPPSNNRYYRTGTTAGARTLALMVSRTAMQSPASFEAPGLIFEQLHHSKSELNVTCPTADAAIWITCRKLHLTL